jgi:hypothetical protein
VEVAAGGQAAPRRQSWRRVDAAAAADSRVLPNLLAAAVCAAAAGRLLSPPQRIWAAKHLSERLVTLGPSEEWAISKKKNAKIRIFIFIFLRFFKKHIARYFSFCKSYNLISHLKCRMPLPPCEMAIVTSNPTTGTVTLPTVVSNDNSRGQTVFKR